MCVVMYRNLYIWYGNSIMDSTGIVIKEDGAMLVFCVCISSFTLPESHVGVTGVQSMMMMMTCLQPKIENLIPDGPMLHCC